MPPETSPPKATRLSLFRNWISLMGMVVVIGALFSFLLLFALGAIAKFSNPYVSILTYIGVPAFLFLGIALALIGVWWERRRRAHGCSSTSLQIDLNKPRDRRGVVAFIAGSVVFLLLTAICSYNALNFTESVTFCGETCHKVMRPENVTHANGPPAGGAGAGGQWGT